MNRRSFLKTLVAIPVAAAAAPAVIESAPPAFDTIDCTQEFGIDFEWDSVEADLELDRFFAESLDHAKRANLLFDREYDRPFRMGDVVKVRSPLRYQA